MKLVIVESPYAGKADDLSQPWRFLFGWLVKLLRRWRNVLYARALVRECVLRGWAPIASHLLFTQPGILRDEVPEERMLGIDAGLAWGEPVYFVPGRAPMSVLGCDLGVSAGMEIGVTRALRQGREHRTISLPGWARLPAWVRR